MRTFVVLLRGINVGGKNKVSMAELRRCLEDLGFEHVSTLIASGNVVLRSDRSADEVRATVEAALPNAFDLDTELIKALVLTGDEFQAVIDSRPDGFGDEPETYHSDAIFLMDVDARQAMGAFNPREGVDVVWPGPGVIYSQRLSELRTKSRLSTAMSSPLYKSMTIRSWSTTLRLAEMVRRAEDAATDS